jgi:two-component system phosphate regulon sensor histidine kinase PhoR
VYNASQLLLTEFKDRMDNKVLELVEVINIGGKRLKKLVYDILDASRIESNNLKLRLGEENLIKIIKEAINDMKYLVSKRNLFLDSDLPYRIKIEVDHNRIKRVFTNLLSNAIKNTPPKGKINIYVRECDDYVDICIRDSGVGLIEKEKQKIFKKFGKIERYGKGMDIDTEGSGLGLYLSKKIVQLHGGQIFVESKGRNKGAEFIVRLHKKIPI